MKLIQIDIDRSRRSRAFNRQERLWQTDLDRLLGMFKEQVESLVRYRADVEVDGADQRRHRPAATHSNSHMRDELNGGPTLSVAIFGPAGSGKSSLLKTLVHETRRGRDHRLAAVATIDVIQPARFGEGDHLLYAVVAAALNEHQERRKENPDY